MERRQSEFEFKSLPWRRSDLSGIGIVCGPGGWRCIDIDNCTSFLPVERILNSLGLPHTYPWVVKTGSGKGWHIWIRCNEELPAGLLTGKKGDPGVQTGMPKDELQFDHLELRWVRCQSIAPPSLHVSGGDYQFYNKEPAKPPALISVDRVVEAVRAVCKLGPPQNLTVQRERLQASDTGVRERELVLLDRALGRAKQTKQRNESGLCLACQLRDSCITQSVALEVGKAFVDEVANDKDEDEYTFEEFEHSVTQAYSRPPRENIFSDEKKTSKPTQAQLLIDIAQKAELFHSYNGDAYVSYPVDDHIETAAVDSKQFKYWLAEQMHRSGQKPPNTQAFTDALLNITAQAKFEGVQREVYLRSAMHEGCIYIDLCNEAWEVVEISPTGWKIIDDAPVRFIRCSGMLPLSKPEQGGSLSELLPFVNLKHPEHAVLLFGWLVHALHPKAPQPVLVLTGEQGTGKSTVSKLIRSLVDPSISPIRGEPRNEHELVIAAENGWVQVFENLSRISPWLSDALCRLSTGGGFATRKLFTGRDQELFFARRPIILNGIDDLTTRPDLADRAISIFLARIPDEKRLTEHEFWRNWETVKPRLQGAIFDAMVIALREYSNTHPNRLPRMADFTRWVLAAEQSFPDECGDFLMVYTNVRREAEEATIERDPVGLSIVCMLEKEGRWIGSMTDLRAKLLPFIPNSGDKEPHGWPKNGKAMSARLRRIAPALRAVGITVDDEGKHPVSRRQMFEIKYVDSESSGNFDDSESQLKLIEGTNGNEVFHEGIKVDESKHVYRSSEKIRTKNGLFNNTNSSFESSKDPKDKDQESYLPAGTIVKHQIEGWEGTVTPTREGDMYYVFPFGSDKARRVKGVELVVKYSVPK